MNHHVLLLDSSFLPIRVIDWKRAMTLFFGGRAQIIEEHENIKVHSPNKDYPMPKVIRLLKSFTVIKYVKFSRDHVFIRDNFQCQYCGEYFKKSELTLDHIFPKSRGGKESWQNMTTCCKSCNNKKADRTPSEAKMPLLSKPTEPTHTYMLFKKMKNKTYSFSHWFGAVKDSA